MSKKKLQQSPSAPYDRFRMLFEQSLDAVYIGTPDGAIIDVNQAWLNLFGYEREDLAKLNASALYADPAERADFVRRMNETGFVRDEVRYRRKDGSVFDCQRVQAAMRDADGNVVAYQGVIRNITAQKKAEEALSVELAWRRILLEQSRDGIVVLDQDGKVVEANLRFAEMLGRSPEELLQLHVQDWDVPTPRERLEEMIRDVDESGDHFETQHRRKDGTVYDVEISTNAAVFGEQKLVFCVCRDITERKRVQKALEQSESRLRFLTEHTADIIWTIDMELRTTYMSPSVERVLGFTAEEWMRLRFDEFATPESVSREYAELQIQLELEASGTADPNRTLTLEIEMYHKNGSTVWMELAMRAIRDDAGKLVGMVGVSRDITERRKTISALRESEERFRSLFEQSMDAIYVAAPDGRILEANQAWMDLFGYTREDLTTLKAVDVYAEPGARDASLQRIAEAGYVKDAIRLKKKNGAVFDCERSVIALRDQSGALVAYQGVQRDVTEQRRARAELEHLARFDALTGILNRRLILEKVDEWIVHVRRYKGHLSVVMLDIDHFKLVNDRYGHQVGDRVLADTAHLLQRSLRQTDFAGRYGGEEFLLVLPQTDAAGAAVIAERARVILQGTAMHDAEGGTYGVTASFGVAEWSAGNDVDALVGRADAAMYRAKEAGRNRVEVAPFPEHTPPEK